MSKFIPFPLQNFFLMYKAFFGGVKEKYPICCVLEYCLDVLEGRNPFCLRGQNKVGYVPCSKCLVTMLNNKKSLSTLSS
jgi:hypothetical protein